MLLSMLSSKSASIPANICTSGVCGIPMLTGIPPAVADDARVENCILASLVARIPGCVGAGGAFGGAGVGVVGVVIPLAGYNYLISISGGILA